MRSIAANFITYALLFCLYINPLQAKVDTLFHLVSGSYNDDAMALERANELSDMGYKPFVVPAGEFNRVVFKVVYSKQDALREMKRVPGSWYFRVLKSEDGKIIAETATNPTTPKPAPDLSINSAELSAEKNNEEIKKNTSEAFQNKLNKALKTLKSVTKNPIFLAGFALLALLLLLVLFRKKLTALFKSKPKVITPYKCNDIIVVGRTSVNLLQTLFRRNFGFVIQLKVVPQLYTDQSTLAQITTKIDPKKSVLKTQLIVKKKWTVEQLQQNFEQQFSIGISLTHLDTGEKLSAQDTLQDASEKGYKNKLEQQQKT
ncbi:MAG: SPOR domain-containing protein [Luteibaculaceae bacterium]